MKFDHVAIPAYIITLLFINISYLAVFLGIFATTPTLVKYLNIGIQCFLCFFLMIRFHPAREKYQLNKVDIMFIFGTGFILFTNLVLVELVQIPMVGDYINRIFKYFGKTTYLPILQISVSKE